MKPKNKKEFLNKVLEEMDIIKQNATPEEIARLDPNIFDGAVSSNCIYGLMTGSCHSERARKIHPKLYANIRGNGSEAYTFKTQNYEDGIGYTALEKYLFMITHKKCLEIISYLKGEINEIILT